MCNVSRLLQISSFNGKMNALNEVNKLIANVTYNLHKHGQGELDEWLTAEKVAVSDALILKMFVSWCLTSLFSTNIWLYQGWILKCGWLFCHFFLRIWFQLIYVLYTLFSCFYEFSGHRFRYIKAGGMCMCSSAVSALKLNWHNNKYINMCWGCRSNNFRRMSSSKATSNFFFITVKYNLPVSLNGHK